MPPAPLTSSNLHDPVLPLVRPVPVALRTTQTIADAHAAVRAVPRACDIPHFYVLDDHDRLAGLVPAGHLLTAPLDQRVDQVMVLSVPAIPSWATVLIASEYFATKKLKAFPVIHGNGTLAGTLDDSLFTGQVISVAQETYDEIFQLVGIHATSMRTPWTSFLDRFPWLLSNMSGGLLCAFIASRFEGLLQNIVVLSLFIPIVLALGESVSMQSATLTLQGLSDDSLSPRRIFPALWREARTAVLLGLSSGTLVALVVLAWRRELMSALVIGGAITASILMACFFGVLIPTLVRLFKADPRIAAGPLVLATTDIVTLVSYLWLGSVVLGG
ncbi:MAG: magnesium transporter [Vicinamibacterales bacterium]